MSTQTIYVFKDHDAADGKSTIHDKYNVVPSVIVPNNNALISENHKVDA